MISSTAVSSEMKSWNRLYETYRPIMKSIKKTTQTIMSIMLNHVALSVKYVITM